MDDDRDPLAFPDPPEILERIGLAMSVIPYRNRKPRSRCYDLKIMNVRVAASRDDLTQLRNHIELFLIETNRET